MTLQEMFNKAYLGLAGQKFEKSSKAGVCLYRGPDGKKCAVGHLIDDAHYTEELEHKAAYQPMVRKALEASGVPVPVPPPGVDESKETKLLNAMQLAHDVQAFQDFDNTEIPLKGKLAKVAADFNLTVPEIP